MSRDRIAIALGVAILKVGIGWRPFGALVCILTLVSGSTARADVTSPTGIPVAATAGQPFDGAVASFSSRYTDLSNFSATIDWGDGTPATAGRITPCTRCPDTAYDVAGTHTYSASGSHQIRVEIASARDATTGTATATATVADPGSPPGDSPPPDNPPLVPLPDSNGSDFDGDGFDDLAVGVPTENVGPVKLAGAVNVIYGSPGGLAASGNQLWTRSSPGILGAVGAHDRFGASLTAGDFNGDGYDDLAIGAPLDDLESGDAGAVNVIYGSAGGLIRRGNQLWHQDSPGIAGGGYSSDGFGESLAAGDLDGDGRDDLAVGVGRGRAGSTNDAGAVNVIYGSAGGLSTGGNQLWHQDSSGIAGVAEYKDCFGCSLSIGDFNGDHHDDLGVGVPKRISTPMTRSRTMRTGP